MTTSPIARALDFFNAGAHDKAEQILKRFLLAKPLNVDILFLLGVVSQAKNANENAINFYDRAIKLQPKHGEAHYNKGLLLLTLGRHHEALASHNKAVELKPNDFWCYVNRGNTLAAINKYEEAFADYTQALKLNQNLIEARSNRGNVLRKLKRYDEALADYDKALALNPDFAEAWSNRGVVFNELKRYGEALADYDKALALNPNYAEAWLNRGTVFNELKRYDEALVHCDKALAINPNYADAWLNLGTIFNEIKRYDEALSSYGKALALNPRVPYLLGNLVHVKMHVCNWEGLQDDFNKVCRAVESGEKAATPFSLLAVSSSATLQKKCAEIYSADKFPCRSAGKPTARPQPQDKIRVGYFSSDFSNHPVSYLTAGLYELHDRSRFEVIGFGFNPAEDDDMTRRLKGAFDRFVDVRHLEVDAIVKAAEEWQLDIAVNLNGHTAGGRNEIFAARVAPIQINYLGYPGTMGAACIDYIIGDPIVIPPDHQPGYSEKVAYLPHTFQANDAKREIADTPSRAALGLPESAFVFCCFNASYKFNPTMFNRWLRLLKEVEGSVLWLVKQGDTQMANLTAWAESQGVSGERLIFADKRPYSQHLARYRAADLVLDTLPFNGGTTTSDALWAGLPVVTCVGDTFAGRMAASLLHAVGLPELVTHSLDDYEALAVALAKAPGKLAALKQKLAQNRTSHPLFDTALFTRHLEAAYIQMQARHQAGLAPDHIYVEA